MNTTSIFLQTLIGGIGIGSLYALVALGYSMVFRSMGLVNFAHGSIYMVGTYLGIMWYQGYGFGLASTLPYCSSLSESCSLRCWAFFLNASFAHWQSWI